MARPEEYDNHHGDSAGQVGAAGQEEKRSPANFNHLTPPAYLRSASHQLTKQHHRRRHACQEADDEQQNQSTYTYHHSHTIFLTHELSCQAPKLSV